MSGRNWRGIQDGIIINDLAPEDIPLGPIPGPATMQRVLTAHPPSNSDPESSAGWTLRLDRSVMG